MTWESFYLTCFFVGCALAAFGALSGFQRIHLPLKLHLGHATWHAHGVGPPAARGAVSPFNFATFAVFLAWFGGVGYLLAHYSRAGLAWVFSGSLLVGFLGAGLIYLFLVRVFLAHERPLVAADFDMIGVLGRLSVPIREGGTGEIIYSQAGTRRSAGARSEDGHAIPRNSEVVVTRYERGIAYVRRWQDLANEDIAFQRSAPDPDSKEEP